MKGTTGAFSTASGTVLDRWPLPPCAAFLGYEFVSIDRAGGRMKVAFEGGPQMLNPRGTVQGGFVTAMLDDAMGSMVVALSEGRQAPLSVDLHVQFHQPVKVGRLICEAEIVHMTRSTAFTRASLFDAEGALLATAVQTARLTQIAD